MSSNYSNKPLDIDRFVEQNTDWYDLDDVSLDESQFENEEEND